MKKLLVIFNNIRGYKSIEPVLEQLSNEFMIKMIFIPFSFDPSSAKISKVKFQIINSIVVSNLEYDKEVICRICESSYSEIKEADLILMTDIQNYPGAALYNPLKKINSRARIIGFQHGLIQVWNGHWFNRLCDFYIAYGKQFINFYPNYRKGDVLYCGIPKLDQIKNIKVQDENYILFIGQKEPAPEVINPLLGELEVVFGKKVLVRNHPQYPRRYKATRYGKAVDGEDDLWTQIANASFVITTHSTCIVEALLIGKKVIILPDDTREKFNDYRWKVNCYSAKEIKKVLKDESDWNYRHWLEKAIYTLDFNSTELTVNALLAISGKLVKGNILIWFKSKFINTRFYFSYCYRLKKKFLTNLH